MFSSQRGVTTLLPVMQTTECTTFFYARTAPQRWDARRWWLSVSKIVDVFGRKRSRLEVAVVPRQKPTNEWGFWESKQDVSNPRKGCCGFFCQKKEEFEKNLRTCSLFSRTHSLHFEENCSCTEGAKLSTVSWLLNCIFFIHTVDTHRRLFKERERAACLKLLWKKYRYRQNHLWFLPGVGSERKKNKSVFAPR